MASNINVMVQYTNVTSSCTNEQGSFDHTSVYILSFVVVSVVGVFFNWLVLLGVRGNSRLGTTVNILLVWISTSAIMQSTVGALAKILIFGKLTTTHVKVVTNSEKRTRGKTHSPRRGEQRVENICI